MSTPGRKDDTGKLDITLLFDDLPHALEAVTEVLQWTTTKKEPIPYSRGSWQGVTPFQPRYRAAMLRHIDRFHQATSYSRGSYREGTGLRDTPAAPSTHRYRCDVPIGDGSAGS